MSTPPVISALPDVPATSDPQFEIKAPALFNAIKNTFIGEVNSVASWINAGSWLTNPLAVGSGGTGLTTIPTGRILYGNDTSAISTSSSLTYDGTTFSVLGNLTVDTNTLVVDAANNRVSTSGAFFIDGASGMAIGPDTGFLDGGFNLIVNNQHADFSIGVNCRVPSSGNELVAQDTHSGISGSCVLFRGNRGGLTNDILFFAQPRGAVSAGDPIALTASRMFIKGLTGNVGIGGGYFTPLGKLDSRATSGAQIVASYDNSNSTGITTNSSGDCTISPTGDGLTLDADDIRINQSPAGTAGSATGTFLTLNLNGTVYKIALLANA